MANFVIVGGSSGIGLQLVKDLLQERNHVHVLSRTTSPEWRSESQITYSAWDAEGTAEPEIPFETVDGLVYCPGTIQLKPFHRIKLEDFEKDLTINVLGAIRVLQTAFPLLKKSDHPSVVLFSTVAVQQGMNFHSSIASAKGAVEGLVRSLAAEWAPTIRVNGIAPSITDTPLSQKLLSSEMKREASAKRHPLQKIGEVQDLSAAAQFLLSDHSSWITGHVLPVDGGLSQVGKV